MVKIRAEFPGDATAIHRIDASAFETDAEARLDDALRAAGGLVLSLDAEDGGELAGHVAFSPVTVASEGGTIVTGVALGPVAVVPERQRRGLGAALIEDGLRRLATAGHRFCILLGHPEYYPRFGFVPASRYGIRWEHPAPDEAFMVRELITGGLDGVAGVVRYRPEFAAV